MREEDLAAELGQIGRVEDVAQRDKKKKDVIDRLFKNLTKVDYSKYRLDYAMDKDESDHELSKVGSGSKLFFKGLLSSPSKVKPIPQESNIESNVSMVNIININPKPKLEMQDSCAICFEDFNDHQVALIQTDCSHIFHEQCLRGWVEQKLKILNVDMEDMPECPNCRKSIKLKTVINYG